MITTLKRILKIQSYQPLNLIEISGGKLLHNFKFLSSLNKRIKIAPVLKSNAYGHGLTLMAKSLDQAEAPFFCVDSIYEAYELLKAQVKTPVLIMGYITPENLKVKQLPFSYAVSTLDLAQAISKYQPNAGIHIFVDTGMHREGVPFSELSQFLEQLKKIPNLKVEGLMSHLATGEKPDDLLTKLQIKNFQKAQEIVKNDGFHPKWIHLQNSDGLVKLLALHLRGANVNMARIGLALYGISSDLNLKPILNFRSRIIQIKKLKKGDRVGYGGTFIAKKPMIIGVLPAGYYDGVDLRLSNKGFVTIGGIACPIIGRVSMNLTTIDLTKLTNPTIGQSVTIYSNNSSDPNSIQNSAKICKTIPYDLLVHLAPSTKRVVV